MGNIPFEENVAPTEPIKSDNRGFYKHGAPTEPFKQPYSLLSSQAGERLSIRRSDGPNRPPR